MSHSPTSSEAWELRGDNTGWSTSEQDVAKQKDAEQGGYTSLPWPEAVHDARSGP